MAIQVALPPPEVSKGASQTGDQNQGVEGDKDKDKGKEKLPSLEAKNVAEDAAAKTKEVEARLKKLILRPRMLLSLNRARRKILLLLSPRLSI